MIQLLDKYSQNKQAIAIYMEHGMSKKAQETQNSLNLCYAYSGRPLESNEAVENASRKARNE